MGPHRSSLSLGTSSALPPDIPADTPILASDQALLGTRRFNYPSFIALARALAAFFCQPGVVGMGLGIEADSLTISLGGPTVGVTLRDGECRGVVARRVPDLRPPSSAK